MKTEDVVIVGSIYLAELEGVQNAFLEVVGLKIDAWYKVSSKRVDNGLREEVWFLTPSKIIRSVITVDDLLFTIYKRTDVLKAEKYYDIGTGTKRRTTLRRAILMLMDHGKMELPKPDETCSGEHTVQYVNFINELTK